MSIRWPIVWFLIVIAAAQASDPRILTIGGLERSYIVHRPAELGRARQVPLVVMLHGGFGTGDQAERAYHWDEAADQHGFVVVYPDGYRRSWNAGGLCCGQANRESVDDVGFLDRLIDTLRRDENIDGRRIYMTGMSNGAAMTYRYACDGHIPLAAIGPVAGSFSAPCTRAVRPVAVMEVHGLEDRAVPFAGGHSQHRAASNVDWLGVERTLDTFRLADRCPRPIASTVGTVETSTALCGRGGEVVLVTIAGAGHQWPGGEAHRALVAAVMGLDQPSTALDATEALWHFFSRHTAN